MSIRFSLSIRPVLNKSLFLHGSNPLKITSKSQALESFFTSHHSKDSQESHDCFISASKPILGQTSNNLILLTPQKSGIILNGSSGGTIDMMVSPEGAHFLRNGKSSILARSKEATKEQAHFPLFKQPVDSSNIDRGHQSELTANIVNKLALSQPNGGKVSGMVLTHGTDTIMETAALLSYQRPNIPIIITGAWVSAGKQGSDAVQNIQRAKLLASMLHIPGVFVVIGDDIHLGSTINKVRSGPLAPPKSNPSMPSNKIQNPQPYFQSLNGQPIGHFDKESRIFLNHDQLNTLETLYSQQPDYLKTQSLTPIKPAYVEHLIVNEKTPFKVFEDLFKRLSQEEKPNGAILEGELTHHPEQKKLNELLEKARELGIFGISTNQKAGPFNNNSIPPIHLRAKLASLLGSKQAETLKNLPRLLQKNLTGEVIGSELAKKTWFKLPQDPIESREILIVTPSFSATEIQDASQRLLRHPSIAKPKLLIIGFGDGHIPIGALTLKERIINNIRLNRPELAESLQKTMQSKTGIEGNWTIANAHSNLTDILGNSDKAKEYLKKALEASHPNLAAVAQALSQGIDVRMDTKVSNSPATLKGYEIGTILSYLGVKPV